MVAPVPAEIPNLRPRPPAAPLRRRSLLLLTTHHPQPTLFLSPLCFHILTNCFFPQPLYLDNDPHCPPGVGVQASNLSPNSVPPRRCLPRPCRGGKSIVFMHLLPLSRLFALFSALPPFVFNRLQPLFAKYRGWGIPNSTTGHPGRGSMTRYRLSTVGCELRSASTFAAVVGGGGDSHAAEFVEVILAIEDAPLFTVLEDLFFLRRDALADFRVGFLFFFQRGGENLHDLLANRVAGFDKFHV